MGVTVDDIECLGHGRHCMYRRLDCQANSRPLRRPSPNRQGQLQHDRHPRATPTQAIRLAREVQSRERAMIPQRSAVIRPGGGDLFVKPAEYDQSAGDCNGRAPAIVSSVP